MVTLVVFLRDEETLWHVLGESLGGSAGFYNCEPVWYLWTHRLAALCKSGLSALIKLSWSFVMT